MWAYMAEQPQIMETILDTANSLFQSIPTSMKQKKQILLSASGSSYNAALILKPFFKNLDLRMETPFELRYHSSLLESEGSDKLLIVISQTGKSIGTLECLHLAKKHGISSISLTSDNQSPIAQEADVHINLLCGEESVGPKTKGFTASVVMLHMLLLEVSKDDARDEVVDAYRKEGEAMLTMIEKAKAFGEAHRDWAKADGFSVVGYGMNHGTAREGSLKLLETMQIPVMNYDMEEFMHGPHRTITKNSHLIFIQHHQEGKELMDNLIQFARSITPHVLVLDTIKADEKNTIHLNENPTLGSWVSAVVVFQVLCTLFPEYNGVNSAKPIYGEFAGKVGTRIL